MMKEFSAGLFPKIYPSDAGSNYYLRETYVHRYKSKYASHVSNLYLSGKAAKLQLILLTELL